MYFWWIRIISIAQQILLQTSIIIISSAYFFLRLKWCTNLKIFKILYVAVRRLKKSSRRTLLANFIKMLKHIYRYRLYIYICVYMHVLFCIYIAEKPPDHLLEKRGTWPRCLKVLNRWRHKRRDTSTVQNIIKPRARTQKRARVLFFLYVLSDKQEPK